MRCWSILFKFWLYYNIAPCFFSLLRSLFASHQDDDIFLPSPSQGTEHQLKLFNLQSQMEQHFLGLVECLVSHPMKQIRSMKINEGEVTFSISLNKVDFAGIHCIWKVALLQSLCFQRSKNKIHHHFGCKTKAYSLCIFFL